MAQLIVATLFAASVASASALGKCSAGPVGSCRVLGCSPTRGPAKCIGNQCMCMDGYCEEGNVHKQCNAQVGTCSVLPCSWKHGGVLATSCESGFCLCHTGYHNDGHGVCTRGWWPETMLAAMNSTERDAALAAEAALPLLSERQVWSLASHFTGFIAAAAVPMALYSATARLRRAMIVEAAENEPRVGYTKLLNEGDSLVA